jgi:ribosomal protein S27AE
MRRVSPTNAERICPECGVTFTATHGKQVFCEPVHKEAFHHTMKMRGKVAMPFVLVWRSGKRGRTDDTAYALSELSRLADMWNTEDAACGRRPDLIVSAKNREEWRAADIGDRHGHANTFVPA